MVSWPTQDYSREIVGYNITTILDQNVVKTFYKKYFAVVNVEIIVS